MKIEKYSFGMGDRFGRQGRAQLQAIIQASEVGLKVTPVWNKSDREHTIIKSEPTSVRHEAEAAIAALGWTEPYRVDADHINLNNVHLFIAASDFYTIDVADQAGKLADESEIARVISANRAYLGALSIPGLTGPLVIDEAIFERTARKFLRAMQEAGRIYRHIVKLKGNNFIAEVSVDETDQAQTPVELLLILVMLAHEKVPCQTIAPKFTGRFNKGVEYVGDVVQFEKEFEEDLCVICYAIRELGLPETLKLSIHSGSDKFTLYPIINRLLKKHGMGVHVKTAGTTWLEEIIGLAEAGGGGLKIVQKIYMTAQARFDELVKPYAAVVDIDPAQLPSSSEVMGWTAKEFCLALRHDPSNPEYNRHFRQFLHVSFKVAAEMGAEYTDALAAHETIIAKNVTDNLFRRHLLPIFA